jgi:hypothetical protein
MKVAELWRPARAALDRMTQVPVHTWAETDAVMLVHRAAKIAVLTCHRHNAVAASEQSRDRPTNRRDHGFTTASGR